MLNSLRVHPTIAVQDIERAKKFYDEKLGLKPFSESASGLMYKVGEGTQFLLFPTPSAGTAQNTVMGFTTADLEKDVKELQAKGVIFEEYDYPNLKTENGIAIVPAGKAAWFKDSEGNTIGLVQFD